MSKTLLLEPDVLFAVLSDRTRLRLLSLLTEGELCVCHLVDALDAPQPTISRHLAVLRRTGLVSCRKDGIWCYYALAEPEDALQERLFAFLHEAHQHVSESIADRKRLKKAQRADGCCE